MGQAQEAHLKYQNEIVLHAQDVEALNALEEATTAHRAQAAELEQAATRAALLESQLAAAQARLAEAHAVLSAQTVELLVEVCGQREADLALRLRNEFKSAALSEVVRALRAQGWLYHPARRSLSGVRAEGSAAGGGAADGGLVGEGGLD